MRILVLNYEFPPIGGGGGSATAALCRELAARGHQLRVLTSKGPGTPRHQQRDGYHVQRVFTGRRSLFRASFSSMGAYVLAGFVPGLSLIRSWQPDLIHAHFAVPTGALAWALRRATGTPYLLTAHLGDVPGGVPEKTGGWFRLVRPLTPPIWRSAGAVVAVSEYTRGLAIEAYGVPIEVIPNGVSLPESERLDLVVGEPPRLIFAGRFQPQKNLLALIDSFSEVRKLKWSCVLVGDGPQMGEVRQAVASHGLQDRIQLTGWLSGAQVDSRLAGSDVLVMPSLSEGLPVVGIQALAYGLAIVGSAAGGLAELIQDRVNGRMCPIGDRAALTEALRGVLTDRERLGAMRRASRELARKYDVRTVADAYQQQLEAVAG